MVFILKIKYINYEENCCHRWRSLNVQCSLWSQKNEEFSLSAIISVADNGGTTGLIRDKYGILPPGDFRRAVAALAKDTGLVRRLFEYSFADEE